MTLRLGADMKIVVAAITMTMLTMLAVTARHVDDCSPLSAEHITAARCQRSQHHHHRHRPHHIIIIINIIIIIIIIIVFDASQQNMTSLSLPPKYMVAHANSRTVLMDPRHTAMTSRMAPLASLLKLAFVYRSLRYLIAQRWSC